MDKLNAIKLFFYENKIKTIIILGIIFLLGTVGFLAFHHKNFQNENIMYDDLLEEDKEAVVVDNNETYYYVDIKGEVKVPGVYSILKGKRVVDAINQAGGLKEDADTSLLNLSLEVEDGMVIIIDSKESLKTENTSSCNNSLNDACIDNTKTVIANKSETINKESVNLTKKININKASLEELTTLNKIGNSKAQAIIDYRAKNGLFKSIEEIKEVNGIGNSIFETIKDNITI